MNWGILPLALTQSALLALGQVLLKFGLSKMEPFGWHLKFWRSALLNWEFACSGLSFGAASILWMYIIKHYPLSMAYPLVSLSYVFGLISAIGFFHEQVDFSQWAGVFVIVLGCYIIAK